MDGDQLQQLQAEVQLLHQELQATQARLQQLQQRLHQLGMDSHPEQKASFFKTPYQPRFSLENFIGLRLIHLVGIVVLVIGLSIGVKYAIDQQLISESARITLAYSAGALLYLLSWRLKKGYSAFSGILFSGAMASLYFTSYAAFVYYSLMPFAIVFVVMILLTLFTVYQALTYNRQEIAVLGLVGAYGIPFLISANSGRADLLFTYIALINAAVVFLAFKRSWKGVALLAQGITWLLLLGWALTRFTPAQQTTAFVFGNFFFLLFSAYALSNTILRRQQLGRIEVRQVFLANLALYALLAITYPASLPTTDYRFLHGGFFLFTAVQAAAFALFLRTEFYLKKGLVLLSLTFFLLFIGAQWDGIIVTLLWLLTALVLFGVGFALKAVWLRLSALVLMGVTLAKLVLIDSMRFSTVQKIIAYLTLGVLLLVVGFFYQRFKEQLGPSPSLGGKGSGLSV
jgi:uncharacterized membrane protein